jgi:hypothetical protein
MPDPTASDEFKYRAGRGRISVFLSRLHAINYSDPPAARPIFKFTARAAAPVLLAFTLAACAPQQPARQPAQPAPVQADTTTWYLTAAAAGTPVYRIDPAASLLTIFVHRGGTLARFGHDHVVASRALSGFTAPSANRADLRLRLDELTVDEPALRRAAGLATDPDADAIAGTRTNMLTRVLDAEHFPEVYLHAEREGEQLRVAINLHGQTRSYLIPATISDDGATVTAAGALPLKQTDFGITPMSVMGGAIAVEDQLDLNFQLLARRLP